jgi:hypothetical protein
MPPSLQVTFNNQLIVLRQQQGQQQANIKQLQDTQQHA